VHVVRGDRSLTGAPGELVSILALHGRAEGVTTDGLLYPLTGEALEPGSSRGVSNVFVTPTARIRMARGVLLAVLPAAEEPLEAAEGAK
jgi:thiamine pyrophosphokinase